MVKTSSRSSNLSQIEIRPARPNDAADVYEIIRDPRVAANGHDLPSREFSEIADWLHRPILGQHRLVADTGARVIGLVSLIQNQKPRLIHSSKMELIVNPGFWNKGVGSMLTKSSLEIADKWLNNSRIEVGVLVNDRAAAHLYEEFGFEAEGVRRSAVYGSGRWFDEIIMARLRSVDYQSGPYRPDSRSVDSQGSIKFERLDIRPMHPDDVGELYDIYRHPAVCRTTLQMPSQEVGLIESKVNNTVTGLHRFVAVADSRVVGVGTLKQYQNPRLSHAAILGLMVHPSYWSQGVANKIMTHLLELADNWLNLRRIELDVNVDNLVALYLYEKYGFRIEGTRRHHAYGDGRWVDSHFMARIRDN